MKPGAVSDFETTTEIIHAAQQKLDPEVWDYITGGTETETTIRRNREAIEALAFRARVLRNVVNSSIRQRRCSVRSCGFRTSWLRSVVCKASNARRRGLASPQGAIARSTCCRSSFRLAAHAGRNRRRAAAAGDKWFQLYVRRRLRLDRTDTAFAFARPAFARSSLRSTSRSTATANGRRCSASCRKAGATPAMTVFRRPWIGICSIAFATSAWHAVDRQGHSNCGRCGSSRSNTA